ncbi:MAG TPA: 6,7-dimethyl-8-ribityllumazine synthase [Gaiellaceae bacterium]|nr:6,7-dimethyl-8-ribityllumazine synthase [Gaiellaceae bacterium]
MSTREQWPGEPPDLEGDEVHEADEEEAVAEADDTDEPAEADDAEEPELRIAGHADGELDIPDDVDVLEGEARSTRRGVGIVVSRQEVETSNRLLAAALAELDRAGVARDNVLVMAVPGAFELPIAAMALAKTRRYACVVALGSANGVVAGEAASGLQLAGLETGVPVAFGVLVDDGAAADARGAEAVRNALEMADLFQQLRAAAQPAK